MFGISTLKFVKKKNIVQNKKTSNMEPKMPYLCLVGFKFEKVLSYLKSAPSNLSKCQDNKESLNLAPKLPFLGISD